MPPATPTASDLKALVRAVPDFPATGILFRDVTTLMSDGAGLAGAIDALAALAADLSVDAVAGIEARGFIFGAALAQRLGTGFIPLRKAGKLPVPAMAEDYALEYGEARLELDPTIIRAGQSVLLLDDLLATGGTALAAARLLRRAGAHCTHALFVIDLPDLGGMTALSEQGIEGRAVMAFDGH
ncbi:adenine phosphoribosyltransferase [Aurantiacibacter xanthus]|uniref:Adenine phosphoribosyltransferase n=1 Tax=Aurantiacibacter xanthus TaxID=1784712 RepID=A0A3A1P4M5_9SPHN|nr:adenine phosphoribosyltransferase [Aurantiacibacter xanthus]RIV81778.1 adenine phosphoribosyltransferase [Aurantiacibacter xanthus]